MPEIHKLKSNYFELSHSVDLLADMKAKLYELFVHMGRRLLNTYTILDGSDVVVMQAGDEEYIPLMVINLGIRKTRWDAQFEATIEKAGKDAS